METVDLLVGACLVGSVAFCSGFFVSQWAHQWLVNSTQSLLDARTKQRDKADRELVRMSCYLDRFADDTLILHEGPCTTPDGRLAYIESFTQTPMAIIKHDDDQEDECFDGRTCYPRANNGGE